MGAIFQAVALFSRTGGKSLCFFFCKQGPHFYGGVGGGVKRAADSSSDSYGIVLGILRDSSRAVVAVVAIVVVVLVLVPALELVVIVISRNRSRSA